MSSSGTRGYLISSISTWHKHILAPDLVVTMTERSLISNFSIAVLESTTAAAMSRSPTTSCVDGCVTGRTEAIFGNVLATLCDLALYLRRCHPRSLYTVFNQTNSLLVKQSCRNGSICLVQGRLNADHEVVSPHFSTELTAGYEPKFALSLCVL